MNENQTVQKKRRFNIIDFILIVAVLACAIGIAFRYNLQQSFIGINDDEVYVTCLVEDLSEGSANAFIDGETVYNSNTKKLVGTMVSHKIRTAQDQLELPDGTVTLTENPYRRDLVCVIKVKGRYSEKDGFMIGGNAYIGAGLNILLRSQSVEFNAVVLDVQENMPA